METLKVYQEGRQIRDDHMSVICKNVLQSGLSVRLLFELCVRTVGTKQIEPSPLHQVCLDRS